MRALSTARLGLEPLEAAHADELFDLLAEPALYRFIEEKPHEDVERLRERFRMLEQRGSPDGREAWLNWLVRERGTGAALGYVQATIFKDARANVAYVIGVRHQGQGYAREAVDAMMGELAARYGVERFVASVDPRNERSIALLRALGFHEQRTPEGGDLSFARGPRPG